MQSYSEPTEVTSQLLCPTCLCINRKHFPLDNNKYGSLFGHKIIKDVDSVCWECINLFHKVYKFKQRVVKAQECLIDMMKLKPLAPLSRLTRSPMKVNDVCCNVTIKKINQDVKLKKYIKVEIESIKSESIDDTNDDKNYEVSISAIKTDEKKGHYDTDEDHSDIKNEKYHDEMNYETKDTKTTNLKRKAKIKVEKNFKRVRSNDIKKMISKNNYMIIDNMSEEEMLAKREADRQTDRYKNKVKYRCELCILGFFAKNVYEKHMKCKHSKEAGIHQCPICEIRFRKINFFKEHVQSHYQKYKCRICPFIGYKLSDMVSHDAKEHDVRRFVCNVCSEEFLSPSSLRLHREMTHQAPPKCEFCDKTFTSKPGLRHHIIHMHKHTSKVKCTVCGVYVRFLKNHMRNKHMAAPEAAYCSECDMRFATNASYSGHLKYSKKHRSDTVLRHVCEICDAKFVTSTGLKKHVLLTHSTERPLNCDRCGKGFDRQSRLTKHVLHVHEGVEKPKDNICDICGKGFNTKFMLSNHIRVHTGEKPFRCDICSAAFSQKSALTTHTRGVHLKLKTKHPRHTTTY